MFGKLIGHQLYLSLTESVAPGWSELISWVSSWVRVSTFQGWSHSCSPSQPPFGWSLRPSKGGGPIVPWEKGGWSPFLLRGLGHISEVIFKKLKTAFSPSNLFLTQEQSRPSSTNSISTHSFTGSDWKGAFVWDLFLSPSFTPVHYKICSFCYHNIPQIYPLCSFSTAIT